MGADSFAAEVQSSGDTTLLSSVNQLAGLTVFAPVNSALAQGRRKLLQSSGGAAVDCKDWGAYMVADYLEFEDLLDAGSGADNAGIRTLSECGRFLVERQMDENKVALRDPSGQELVLDRRDAVPGDGQVIVYPISKLVCVPSSCA